MTPGAATSILGRAGKQGRVVMEKTPIGQPCGCRLMPTAATGGSLTCSHAHAMQAATSPVPMPTAVSGGCVICSIRAHSSGRLPPHLLYSCPQQRQAIEESEGQSDMDRSRTDTAAASRSVRVPVGLGWSSRPSSHLLRECALRFLHKQGDSGKTH